MITLYRVLILALLVQHQFWVHSQCTVVVNPSTVQNINCGEPVLLESQGYSQGPSLFADFNNNSLGAGWSTTQNINYNNPCGPSLDGSPSAWMGSSSTQPRQLNTIGFDLSCGADVCFDLDFGNDNPCGCNDCEDPDLGNEGVYFRYSLDNGITWVDIFYFQPNSTSTGPYYSWNTHCFTLPPGAWSTNTMLQWSQDVGSSANFDHWGIDNVEIQPIDCSGSYYYEWNGVSASQDTTVYPTVSGDYTVLYTNGIDDSCTNVVSVVVAPLNIFTIASPATIACGNSSTLGYLLTPQPSIPGANYQISWTPTTGLSTPNSQFTSASPITTTTYTATLIELNSGCMATSNVTVNVTPLNPGYNYPITTFCEDEAPVNAILTGVAGGTFSSTPGIDLDPITGTIDPQNSVPGMYDVVYKPLPNCPADSTITIIINALPNVNAGTDQIICSGTSVTLTATGADTYVWNNNVTDGVSFTPTSTANYNVIGTDINGCEDSDQVDITVLPQDDATFDYFGSIEFCKLDANPIANITGTQGGSFSYTVLAGGPNLSLDNLTGDIDLLSSDIGKYEIEYNTTAAGLCPALSTLEITIHAMPDADFTASEFIGCEPKNVQFTANSTNPAQFCSWNFGNNATSSVCGTVSATYYAGEFDVSLTIESEAGCISTVTYYDLIDITAMPEANFNASPAVTNIELTDINFTNYSNNSSYYEWQFGDSTSGFVTDENPTHFYPETPAQYSITLTAYSEDSLCSNSISKVVIINDILTFFIPNAFSPNQDQFNNTFKPIFTSGFDYYNYHMLIFNRYGEVIFETFNPDLGWDGYYGNVLVQDGTYIWQVTFGEDKSDKLHSEMGHVTVLK